MPTITFGVGTANITVPCQRAGKVAKRRLGGTGPTANGNLRSYIRWEGNEIPLILIRITQSEAKAIEDLFANGARVPCAGDVINNGGATVDFLGDYTDNMEPADTLRTPSVFLHEVGPVGAGLPPAEGVFLLNEAGAAGAGESGGTPQLATPTSGGGFPNLGSIRVLDADTPPTCGTFPDPSVECTTIFSAAPEGTWATPAFPRDGWLTGIANLVVLSIGGTADKWAHQSSLFKIFLNRGGVDVKTIDTQYGGNGGFAGSAVEHKTASGIIWEAFAGDRLRFELWGRLALHGGYTDGNDGSNLDRQTITYGQGGTGASPVYIGGLSAIFAP